MRTAAAVYPADVSGQGRKVFLTGDEQIGWPPFKTPPFRSKFQLNGSRASLKSHRAGRTMQVKAHERVAKEPGRLSIFRNPRSHIVAVGRGIKEQKNIARSLPYWAVTLRLRGPSAMRAGCRSEPRVRGFSIAPKLYRPQKSVARFGAFVVMKPLYNQQGCRYLRLPM